MNFKKYIYLHSQLTSKYANITTLKIQIKTGIMSTDLKDSIANTWIPNVNDRLYFFPGCSVPRFKVREKFNITIKPEHATAAFISPDGLRTSDTMFKRYNELVTVTGTVMANYFERIYGMDHHFTIKFKSLLLNCDDQIMMHQDVYYNMTYRTIDDAIFPLNIHTWLQIDKLSNDIFNKENVVFYTPVLGSELHKIKCSIYNQDAILKLINEDSIIIDENKYKELQLMAGSSDDENIILVMELMANANYKKSFVYLLLLLKEFASKIQARKKEVKHINFKSLLEFLEIDHRAIDVNLEKMTACLKKHSQFTRINIQRITQLYTHLPENKSQTEYFTPGPVLRLDKESELDYVEDELDEIISEDQEEEQDNFTL